MLHSVISSLLTNITGLSFAEKVGGIVYPLQKQIKGADDIMINKTFPVYGNDPTVCESGDYIEMIPDDRLKSVIYFEATPETIINTRGGTYVTTQSTVSLIAWFNLAKINKALRSGESMLHILASSINGTYKINNRVHAIFELKSIVFRDPSIFAKWSYSEKEKQHLIYPRDFGMVTFDVQLSYDLCDDEPIIDPKC
jgi:hypothetical protein